MPCGEPYPNYPEPSRAPLNKHRIVSIHPSIQEQLGIDPMSKLAAAIERLCDLLEGVRE